MEADGRVQLPEESADAHDRAAGADAGDERVGRETLPAELLPDLRTCRCLVGVDVFVVRELTRQERARRFTRKLFRQTYAAEEPAFLGGYQPDHCAEASNERLPHSSIRA